MVQTVRKFPYGSFLPYYANSLVISNNATTPNTKFDVSAGSSLDTTGTFQIVLDDTVTVDATTTGLNGLDTGVLLASKVYAVYLVSDPVSLQATGCMISLSYAPILPYGYSAFSLIGFITTDASVHFLKGFWDAGNGSIRTFMYDAPQATAITAGNATSYTAIDLSALVPTEPTGGAFDLGVFPRPIYINSTFTPGAASRVLNLQPSTGTGDAIAITGQVTSVPVTTQSMVMVTMSSSLPKINYKVSNSGDAAAINVAGYTFYLT